MRLSYLFNPAAKFQLTLVHADFYSDGLVNNVDLNVWRSSFGINALGGANGDGTADGADFLLWQRQPGLSMQGSVLAIPGRCCWL
jgi:hypothetical protein